MEILLGAFHGLRHDLKPRLQALLLLLPDLFYQIFLLILFFLLRSTYKPLDSFARLKSSWGTAMERMILS
jgi:hypothetical protein